MRYNKYGAIQKLNCRQCNGYFTINLGFEKMHATPTNDCICVKIVFYMRTIQERQEILEIAGRENEPRCYLQIDNEIRWFNANIFRKNHAKYFRPMES